MMRMKKRVILSWSGGKDSAWTLHALRQHPTYEVAALFTSLNSHFDRIAIHGVRRELLEVQASAAGLPLWTVPLPWPCSNADYERCMSSIFARARNEDVNFVAFGDLFLEDIRAYREKQLSNTGLQPVFPLWKLPTAALAKQMIDSGLRARLVCVDPRHISREFVGREFDQQLLSELPPGADPCAENGEFHTFVYAGSMFRSAIEVHAGETVERDGFVYQDLLPAPAVVSST
jgi:uncharacterized protein (TIGR00290 family)